MSSTVAFHRGLQPVMQLLLPRKEQQVLAAQSDPSLRDRIKELARKSTEGEFTAGDREEYIGTAHGNYLAGLRAARTRLLNLRDEPSQLIPDDDEHWYAFGFEKPSDSASPEPPENLVLTHGASGSRTLRAAWDDTRRADNCRLRAKVKATGVQVFNEIVQNSDGILAFPAQLAEIELKITVTGRNAVGESPATGAVTAALP